MGAEAVVKLKPNRGGRFFAGAPWVYADEIALDRRTRTLEPGTVAQLVDAARAPLATVAVNPNSKIFARRLDRPNVEIDAEWIEKRLSRAAELRARLGLGASHRVVHAEADSLPGLVIDRFEAAVVVQPNAAWVERRRTALLGALDRVLAPEVVVWNGASRARSLEGLPDELRLLKGAVAGPLAVEMNGASYLADLIGGQKTGLFLDQRPNHAFVAQLAKQARVLDVFSHVGGFSLAALAGGAAQALAVDGSEPALALAKSSAERMGVSERFETRLGDAFDVMRALTTEEALFEVVVCDPPAFAPNKSALEAGLRAYGKTARLGAALTAPSGVFTICSCSGAVDAQTLHGVAAEAFHKLRRGGRLLRTGAAGPDHPVHPHLPETGYLKALSYQLD